jgi:hypothetical protein
VAGRLGAVAEVICTDNGVVLELVANRIRSLEKVASTEVLSIVKME